MLTKALELLRFFQKKSFKYDQSQRSYPTLIYILMLVETNISTKKKSDK